MWKPGSFGSSDLHQLHQWTPRGLSQHTCSRRGGEGRVSNFETILIMYRAATYKHCGNRTRRFNTANSKAHHINCKWWIFFSSHRSAVSLYCKVLRVHFELNDSFSAWDLGNLFLIILPRNMFTRDDITLHRDIKNSSLYSLNFVQSSPSWTVFLFPVLTWQFLPIHAGTWTVCEPE